MTLQILIRNRDGYGDHHDLARDRLTQKYPAVSQSDLDAALVMTWVDNIEINDWLTRASRRLSQ